MSDITTVNITFNDGSRKEYAFQNTDTNQWESESELESIVFDIIEDIEDTKTPTDVDKIAVV